ncbi:MAG: cytochrome c family protein [Desulfarculus sp.]|nr:cytochrome c family protein [Pseudomonadota bacterium]MBV1717948.1 cytochrome c family protein [Desulfarculus sp.]MBU4576606.1 cytochrome c family protein [Pseudomonadota bacterium]MBU4598065.1 cytochrome c family protein [Pseudomonadota bacterium]MBV1739438.1 cytochrome c family protein [Desulfarculus sp.]
MNGSALYKKVVLLGAAVAALSLCGAVWVWAAGGQAPAQSLAELLERYDSKRCQECHTEIYEQWSRSHHARSLMGLDGFSFMSKYLRKGPLAVNKPQDATLANFPCAKCHLPQLMSAGPKVAQELAEVIWRDDKAVVGRLNIGCLVCHQDKAVVHHRPEPGVLYGPKALPEHEGEIKAVRKSSFMASPAFCGQCHGMGPNFEFTPPVQCATLYGSYLNGYVADGGSRTCLDCHMSGADHTFPPDFSDKEATAKLYRAALPMEVEALPYTFHPGHKENAPQVVVGVTIQNRAGHRIPDG